jgi:hypothetical protein
MNAVKDPSAVYYNGQYIVYASDVDSAGNYNMEYLHFTNWSEASAATPYFLDDNPNLAGYHTAPQVFYFAPQNKWYLIFQSGQPQYSTNSDPTQPQNWTAPQNFFASQPASVSAWLDFWVICDSANCYLFFCDDGGNFWRSSTPIGNFPNGFSQPVIAYTESNAFNLFEADNVYSVEGTGMYLANIECIGGPYGHRFFRALTASSLDGAWTPLGNTESFNTPFLGSSNIAFDSGVSAWTDDFSSGGAVIDGYDQTDPININNLTFLYQGDNPNANAPSYNLIPWQLGLATSIANTPSVPSIALSTPSTGMTVAWLGGLATAVLQVTPSGGFTGAVNLKCSVAYQGQGSATDSPTCSFNPAQVNVAGAAGTSTLTVMTTAATSSLGPAPGWRGAGCVLAALLWVGMAPTRRRRRVLLLALLCASLSLAMVGCGGSAGAAGGGTQNPGTSTGDYQVMVTATSGLLTSTATIPLVVQ